MGFFSFRSIVSGKDIMNYYGDEEVGVNHDGIAMLLPDNTLIVGKYDGYGRIETKKDTVEIFDTANKILNGKDYDSTEAMRTLYVLDIETNEEVAILNKYMHDYYEVVKPSEVVECRNNVCGTIVGFKIDDMKVLYKIESNYDRMYKQIKVMLKSEVKEHLRSGLKFEDYEPSRNADGQGFWASSYGSGEEKYIVLDNEGNDIYGEWFHKWEAEQSVMIHEGENRSIELFED